MKQKNKKEIVIPEIKEFNTMEVKLFMEKDNVDEAIDIDDFFNAADEVDEEHANEIHEEDVKYNEELKEFEILEKEYKEDKEE